MTRREALRLTKLLVKLRDELAKGEYTRESSGLVDAATMLIEYLKGR